MGNTPATGVARRGFTLAQPPSMLINASFDSAGWLHLKQGAAVVIVRPEGISAFKRAVAELGVIL